MNRLLLICAFAIAFVSLTCADDAANAALRKDIMEKLKALSPEAQAASKKFEEIAAKKLNWAEMKAAMDKLMKSFPDKVQKELETVRPTKGGKPLTSAEYFDIMEIPRR